MRRCAINRLSLTGLTRPVLLSTLLAALAAPLAGCSTGPRWPAVTDTPVAGQALPGRWLWAELVTDDVERARRFYGAVFGWQFRGLGQAPRRYTLISADGVPVGGMLQRPASDDQPRVARWVGMLSVADVGQAAAAAKAAGGQVVVEPRRLRGRGTAALLSDPEGARFAVLRSAVGDPPDELPAVGHWFWHELWAGDGDAMAAFYAVIAGYDVERVAHEDDVDEWHLRAADAPRAGIVAFDGAGGAPGWLHYVRVADLAAAMARAEAADGSVVLAPTPAVRDGRIGIVADPLGARIGLVEWPDAKMPEAVQ
jgi:predicted enzyme related to lactoylglutathione lyase